MARTCSKEEDADAARRLFYVAMTRARRSLAMVTMGDRHPIVDGNADGAVLMRKVNAAPEALGDCALRYVSVDPWLVDLSFGGRLREGHPSLRAIGRLQVGDPVLLTQLKDRWQIVNAEGVPVGRMSRSFTPPVGASFVRGSVGAVISWRKIDAGEEYQRHMLRDEWEVVLAELVFR